MENRLYELKNGAGSSNPNVKADNDDSQVIVQAEDDNNMMPEFQNKINDAQRLVERIKENNEKVENLKEKFSRATTALAEKEVSIQLDQTIKSNEQMNQQLRDVMQGIADDVDKSRAQQPNEPETRMKIDQQNAITMKVQDTLKASQSVQMEYRAGLKNKISRQTRLIDNTLSDQQVDDICNDPDKAQQLLQNKLYGQASMQVQNAVADIQDKYRDILKLEQSVNAVFQLFQDMALLVHNQGELIDNIELNMNAAKNYVAKGEKQLIKAKEEHQAARKKTCCIIMIGLVIIVVILGPVLGTQI